MYSLHPAGRTHSYQGANYGPSSAAEEGEEEEGEKGGRF